MTTQNATLAARAMLVDLTIRVWGARKTEDEIAKEVADTHGSQKEMGNFTKKLIDPKVMKPIEALAREATAEHRRRTLPWLDRGARILSAAGYPDYSQEMRRKEAEWNYLLISFPNNYPAYIQDARASLNGLFNPNDYPEPGQIMKHFSFGWTILPIPEAEDFRCDLAQDEADRIRRNLKLAIDAQTEAAMNDVINRIKKVTSHLASTLRAYNDAPEGHRRLYDSATGNIRDLVEILPTLNITGSQKIAGITEEMAKTLCTVSTEHLKVSQGARTATAKAADEILKKLEENL